MFQNQPISVMAQTSTLREGFYRVSNLNLNPGKSYNIENVSFSSRVVVFILDDNQIIQQVLRLIPQSGKFNIIPMEYVYRVVILGDGEVRITEI
ncbi:hypothetical protein [Clostridium cellulovorans]|nr:hypothetical protein [Clostridium cellulovorans]